MGLPKTKYNCFKQQGMGVHFCKAIRGLLIWKTKREKEMKTLGKTIWDRKRDNPVGRATGKQIY